jgi:hypothetical protein
MCRTDSPCSKPFNYSGYSWVFHWNGCIRSPYPCKHLCRVGTFLVKAVEFMTRLILEIALWYVAVVVVEVLIQCT